MQNKKIKYVLILSLILNILLVLFFVFPKNKIRLEILFYKIISVPTSGTVPDFKSTMLLEEFKPVSVLDNQDKRTSKYNSIPIIETHGHLGKMFKTSPTEQSEKFTKYNVKKFINLSFTTGEDFVNLKKEYNDTRIIHFSTFNWKRLSEENFSELMLEDLKLDIKNGSKGIKLWKDFGLYNKLKNGERLKMDDPRLDKLFEECAKNNLIISIHTADPFAFFSPIDEKNERYEELIRHPEWSFQDKKFPKFEEVLKERENLFKRHKNLRFVALHFGEYAHDLEKAEKLLSENPNVSLDIAARIDELGRQPEKAKKFFEKFQDRIFFGMDGAIDLGKLEIYSRFLETTDEYFDYHPSHKPRKGFWKIYGLGLKKEILEKIYYKNADKFY